ERRRAPKPTTTLDPSKTYDVTLVTSCGSITFRLDVKDSPKTTASFVSLVRRRFFIGTVFHRIIPGFVIQGGDPTGTGTEGPGYGGGGGPAEADQVHGRRRRNGKDAGRGSRDRRQPVLHRHRPRRRDTDAGLRTARQRHRRPRRGEADRELRRSEHGVDHA